MDKNEVWDSQAHNALSLPAGYYYVVFELAGYVPQLQTLAVRQGQATVKMAVLMVRMRDVMAVVGAQVVASYSTLVVAS